MSWLRRCRVAVTVLAICLNCGACAAIRESMAPTGRHVDGEWVGYLRSVPAYDIKGQEYAAAAIEILAGPRMPYRFDTRGTDQLECGRVALLNLSNTNPVGIVDPKTLDVPADSMIKVRGRMLLSFAKAQQRDGFIEPITTKADGWESDSELVILSRGKPKRVRKAKVGPGQWLIDGRTSDAGTTRGHP